MINYIDYMDVIKKYHKKVWDLRHVTGEMEPVVWNTPTPADCIRYASQEINEALSAWMKVNRQHARNNPLSPEVAEVHYLAELGQAFVMLLSITTPEQFNTMLVQHPPQSLIFLNNINVTIDSAVVCISAIYKESILFNRWFDCRDIVEYWLSACVIIIKLISEKKDIKDIILDEISLIAISKILNSDKLTDDQKQERMQKLEEFGNENIG